MSRAPGFPVSALPWARLRTALSQVDAHMLWMPPSRILLCAKAARKKPAAIGGGRSGGPDYAVGRYRTCSVSNQQAINLHMRELFPAKRTTDGMTCDASIAKCYTLPPQRPVVRDRGADQRSIGVNEGVRRMTGSWTCDDARIGPAMQSLRTASSRSTVPGWLKAPSRGRQSHHSRHPDW